MWKLGMSKQVVRRLAGLHERCSPARAFQQPASSQLSQKRCHLPTAELGSRWVQLVRGGGTHVALGAGCYHLGRWVASGLKGR